MASNGRDPDLLAASVHPDWLHHQLRITGPAAGVAAFQSAARGAAASPGSST